MQISDIIWWLALDLLCLEVLSMLLFEISECCRLCFCICLSSSLLMSYHRNFIFLVQSELKYCPWLHPKYLFWNRWYMIRQFAFLSQEYVRACFQKLFLWALRLVSPQNPQCDVRALAQCQLCLVCHCVRQRQEEPEKRILFLGQSELRPASLEINLNQQVRTNDHQIWLNWIIL